MKKIIAVLLMISITLMYTNKTTEVLIPKEAIRFRIIANSNSIDDQKIKYLVRDEIEEEIMSDIEDVNDLSTVRQTLSQNTNKYSTLIEKLLSNNNISTPISVNYGINYFPEKNYKGVKYSEGNYESLVVTLGEGIGNNWWCVLFPPLCLLEAEEEQAKEEVEYKFFVQELIDKFFK